MRSTLAALALCLIGVAAARADWKTMNADINATNFVVANQCSGTLISLKYKLVLTNDHCLEGYVDKIEREETEKDGEVKKVTREVYRDMELKQKAYQGFDEVGAATLQAEIVAHEKKWDLALLKIRADSIPQTVYSRVLSNDKSVQRGDPVYVVGNPYLLDANLNEGHISSTTRKLHWDETNEDIPYYGVDAGINPGNSGGALYNADGELIGVPAADIRGASGLGFAIPIELIRKLLKANCYADVYDPTAPDHDACKKDKLDKLNAIRAKAGLPPIEDEAEEGGSSPAPAAGKKSSLLDFIDRLGRPGPTDAMLR